MLLAVLLFGSLNLIGNTLVTSWRLDLTSNRLFTLSEGTRDLLQAMRERDPIELRFYVSRGQLTNFPRLNSYATRVQDMLREYASRSGGTLRLSVIEPEPFSEEEDEAVQDGMNGFQVDSGGSLAYLGLVGVNETDDREVLPFLSPAREDSLEYDVSKLIHKLSNPRRLTLGVLTGLPIFPGLGNPGLGPQGAAEKPWTIISQLREFMEVRELQANLHHVDPDDIDVLMVAHPKGFSEQLVYAIDQYLLNGGKLLLLLDPLAEASAAQQGAAQSVLPDFGSNLPRLLETWGLEMPDDKVVGDLKYAMRVQVSSTRSQSESLYPPWLRLDTGQQEAQDAAEDAEDFILNSGDFALTGIKLLQMGTVGALLQTEPVDGLEFIPLVQSSMQSGLLERDLILLQRDPVFLLRSLQNADDRYVLAARLRGNAPSAFPDGPPPVEQAEGEEGEAAASDTPAADPDAHVSEGPVQAVLIADTDLLRDLFWYREQSLGTLRFNQEIADNANFLIKAVDHLSGSSELLKLNPRRVYPRNFDRVEEIRRTAEKKYRDEEERLQNALQETEQKLRNLQSPQGPDGGGILSAAQAREIEQFKREQLKTRKQLRAVQHELQKNIERLGTTLKFLNIGLFPALVLLLALIAGHLRAHPRRRTASRRSRDDDSP